MGIVEKNTETAIVYSGYIGIMEKKMKATIYKCIRRSCGMLSLGKGPQFSVKGI